MNHMNWDDYFMNVAILSAERSKDPNTKVGAVIVNEDKRIVGIGYNGFPNGCSDLDFPWAREGAYEDTKYAYVVHAEENAILNSTHSLKEASIYVSLFPCNECAKKIIQSGIREIVYLSDKYNGTATDIASKRMLKASGVKTRQLSMEKTIRVREEQKSEVQN
ncbi:MULTISPECIES: dCMP deaminase family protein [unclassified Exiguobacterium]|uniref:deoxycytidylate deaminase n=1 Tax=unclassified Exiguobacterium TaxID=2644629 RepID=UPI001BEC300F|nr:MULTISPECIES: dCMP deaminase family protein [unclassified Exiguobacterium]